MDVGAAMMSADWVALASLWEAPTSLLFSCIVSLLQLLRIFDYVKRDGVQNQMQISLETPVRCCAKRNLGCIHVKQFSNIMSK
jgi:predicted small integral membrane protein